MSTKYTHTGISLFSGMGGDTFGMSVAGVKVVAYSEKESYIRDTHDMNFKHCRLLGNGNITQTTNEELSVYKNKIHMIFAGFPCQGFSNAGKKLKDDPRNTLFREFVRATTIIRPHVIIGENVKGLLNRKTSDNEMYIDVIVNEFKKLGYSVTYQVFKCDEYGIPQKRERLIILGVRSDVLHLYNHSVPEKDKGTKNIQSIIDHTDCTRCSKLDKTYIDMSKLLDQCVKVEHEKQISIFEEHPYIVSKVKAEPSKKMYGGKSYNTLFSYSKRISPIHCEIVDFTKPSKTIICTYEHQPRLVVPIVKTKLNNGVEEVEDLYVRCFNPTELKKIQSFPTTYKINGNYKQQVIQIGNAVPPLLVYKIVKHVLKK